ncbi:hypothetical protein Tco_0823379 [Tanacetum coccineum]|uniref:Uncharacterized protein n=1 Tax=Tanacetum coccineum TaxID=301880 RepID=A0ABQ5AHR0_9ASTR
MEFQKDEMVVEPVAVVVSNIDDQIISAFMELDPVFNPADVDADIEPWNPYFTVDSFASITNPHAYYNMDKSNKKKSSKTKAITPFGVRLIATVIAIFLNSKLEIA